MSDPIFSVSQAVAVLNQTLDAVYPSMTVVGEISQFTVSKNRWVYADLKDELSKLRLFGTVYQLNMPIEDGMMVEVTAEPRIHPQYGFSLNIKTIKPVGEGSLKKAADLLHAKLEKEGLFAEERKRPVPYGPESIGLIASEQSAAYADFIKIVKARWNGVTVNLYNVAVQGDAAVEEIVQAISQSNQTNNPVDVLVIIRGGGSADDLQAFSTETVTRAVASSRIPTVVGVGHESDISLAELAADLRASTPSNAAELLFPDKKTYIEQLRLKKRQLSTAVLNTLESKRNVIQRQTELLEQASLHFIESKRQNLSQADSFLESIHPKATLKRGFAIVQRDGKLVSSVSNVKKSDILQITLQDGQIESQVNKVQ